MGIEKFFNSLVNNKTLQKDNLLIIQNKIDADFVYIDFNSILYKIAQRIEIDLNKLLYELLVDKNNITAESKEIAEKWNYQIHQYNLDNFKKYFTDELIDNRFIDFITDDLYYIIGDLTNGNLVKKIYISMDGVPNMAKIIEQKKRRYMGYILNESKKEIFSKNKIKLDGIREIYEINKIRFSRGKILGFHEFMLKISSELKNEKFVDNLKKKYTLLEDYIFSGSDVPGEGEKKIMEDILVNKYSGRYAIYSPDADLIILSSIMINKLNNNSEMYILRFDQQEFKYDIVDINVLNQNIYSHIDLENQRKLNKKKVIDDIMFIFTMFGNDFVHKIESIDAKKDFEILLDAYIGYLSKKTSYILDDSQINYDNLKRYISILSELEKDLLNDVYLVKHYKNYNHLKNQFKNIFWFKTLHRTLVNYTLMSNIIFKYLRKWENDINNSNVYTFWNSKRNRPEINYKNVQKFIENNSKYLVGELLKNDFNLTKDFNATLKSKFNASYYVKQFIKMFLIIELNIDLEINDINDKNLYFNFIDIIKNEIFKHNGKKIYSSVIPNIRLDEFTYTTKDKYHSKKIIENLVSEKMKLTDFDIEVYAFEFMLDKYKNKLNAMDDLIGKCYLNYINNQYVYIYDVIEKYHDRYYKIYFGNTYTVSDICEKYFAGICWVFDFYFLKNNPEFNFNNVSPWFYEYHRSPMLIDLNYYLINKKNSELKNIHSSTVDKLIKRENFINPFEHYLYVTPKNSINLGKRFAFLKQIIDDNKQIFPDLNNIIDQIMNPNLDKQMSEYNSDVPIDCRRVSYLSKCTLSTVKDIKFNDFIQIVKKFRDKYDNFKVKEYPFIKKWNNDFNSQEQVGGFNNFSTMLKQLKTNYKTKYLSTGDIEFKKMYKMTKKLLDEI